eukprot:bmy_00654T0
MLSGQPYSRNKRRSKQESRRLKGFVPKMEKIFICKIHFCDSVLIDRPCRFEKPFLHSWDEARNSEREGALSHLSCISDQGYSGQDFDWADYHKQHGTEEAPPFCFRNTSFSRGFTQNMKLEAVNPRNPGELCVASVIAVKGRLMWLHLEAQKKRKIAVVQPEKHAAMTHTSMDARNQSQQKVIDEEKSDFKVNARSSSTVPVEKIPHDLCLFPHLDTTDTYPFQKNF